jgi:non-specific serine/threonine protein kinase
MIPRLARALEMTSPGDTIGPYVVLGPLGSGGMGTVYLARDTRLHREVALKMLPPEFASDSERLGRFRREALTLAALNHPNIATIFGFEEPADGTLALVLERVEGETLADRLERGPLAYEEALQVCAQIAEALEVAHERGVVHRDLKPGNVMLGPRGLVKVLDFGLVKTTGVADPASGPERGLTREELSDLQAGGLDGPASKAPLTEYGTVLGTPGYISPEQIQGGEQDARADIFAFGCVLYECLTGQRAFDAPTIFELLWKILQESVDSSRLPSRMPARLRQILEQCLEKDPELRPEGIHMARVEIEEALGTRRASALRTGEVQVATPHNLPRSLSSFVGREAELEICREALAGTRLLTLTGVGGCGKTRVALRIAEGSLAEFSDGVWFVDLAPVATGERVVETVAHTLGVKEEAGKALADILAGWLGPRRVLIVLDNCEHLIAPCAELVTRLLGDGPQLKFLATSREPLGVAAEHVHALSTLRVPAGPQERTAAAVGGIEAVQLFLERARQVQPGFALVDENAPVVAEICQRLDGIPLAIELAAARVRMLSVEEIRTKLADRFRLLTGGSRTAGARHQTLRATIQWSYDQLVDAEKDFYRSLAVFRGGWSLGTAAAVCMEQGDEFEVLDLLTRLVDKSLVMVERAGNTSRYRFLETVHQYAAERLGEADDRDAVRERHMTYFLALAETAEKRLGGPDQKEWLESLEVEHANLLGAFDGCPATPEGIARGLRFATSLSRFWSVHGHFRVGRRTLEEALRRDTVAAPTVLRAVALVRAGGLALYEGDHAAARPRYEEALAISRELGDQPGIARSTGSLATIAIYEGHLDQAWAYTEQAMALYRQLGQKRGIAQSLHTLGYLALRRGDATAAKESLENAVELHREIGDPDHLVGVLVELGLACARLEDRDRARGHLAEGLAIAASVTAKLGTAYVLEVSAELAMRAGSPERAATLASAAERLRVELGSPSLRLDEQDRRTLLAGVESALGKEHFDRACNSGRAMTFEEATAYTLEWLRQPDPTVPAGT